MPALRGPASCAAARPAQATSAAMSNSMRIIEAGLRRAPCTVPWSAREANAVGTRRSQRLEPFEPLVLGRLDQRSPRPGGEHEERPHEGQILQRLNHVARAVRPAHVPEVMEV